MKRSIYLLIFLSIIGCNKTAYIDELDTPSETTPSETPVVKIVVPRSEGNIIDSDGNETAATKSSDMTRIEKVYDQVISQSLYPHLVVGKVFRKSSVVDGSYVSVGFKGGPYTIVPSLVGAEPKQMASPVLSSYTSNLNEIINEGSFTQSEQLEFTMGQFSSYNELKLLFGNNSSTRSWFKKTTTTTEGEEDRITKATGIYVKFYQTSFTVSMDAPVSCYDGYTEAEKDNLVYLNSISYGRLGIMTLETNYSASYSYSYMKRVVKKLFSSSTTTLTEEEISFLNSSTLKIYYAGATNDEVVNIHSAEDFIRSIHDINLGTFSSDSPGVPIMCSFNNMKDDSRFGIDFEMVVSYDHVYAELLLERTTHSSYLSDGMTGYEIMGDIYIAFYRDRERHPIIAYPGITFRVKTEEFTEYFFPRHRTTNTSHLNLARNTMKSTQYLWKIDAPGSYTSEGNDFGFPDDRLMMPVDNPRDKYTTYYTYSLEPSNALSDPEYTVIGFPILGMAKETEFPIHVIK